jgi:hypothetical protein
MNAGGIFDERLVNIVCRRRQFGAGATALHDP